MFCECIQGKKKKYYGLGEEGRMTIYKDVYSDVDNLKSYVRDWTLVDADVAVNGTASNDPVSGLGAWDVE